MNYFRYNCFSEKEKEKEKWVSDSYGLKKKKKKISRSVSIGKKIRTPNLTQQHSNKSNQISYSARPCQQKIKNPEKFKKSKKN